MAYAGAIDVILILHSTLGDLATHRISDDAQPIALDLALPATLVRAL